MLRWPVRLVTLAAVPLVPVMHAQGNRPLLATPQIRVTAPVAGSPMITLKGNTSPLAQARYDQGAAPNQATGRLRLLLKRSPAQDAALQQFMGGLQDPNSPNYRKWLTPTEFGSSFGIADGDLQAVEGWLQSQGLKVEGVPASRSYVTFSGTTGQVAQAFHTSIHAYTVNGEQHLSNAADPQIPAALAEVVAGVSPLNDFRAKPLHRLGGLKLVKIDNGHLKPLEGVAAGQATPQLTQSQGNNPFLFLTPSDAATIYNAPNAFNRNFKGGPQQTGAGVSIGIVGDSDFPTADYLNYRRLFLNDSGTGNLTVVTDGVDPGTNGDAVEALLDTEVSAGLAPQANIIYYQSASSVFVDGVYSAALRAVEDNSVSVLSFSFGNCELALGQAGNLQISALWQQATAQGITVVVASGDQGSAGCDINAGETQATGGLAVSGFASTPYDVAVGGTDFDVLSSSFAQYVNGAASGGSTPGYGSALSYIPENPWNDSISNGPGPFSADSATQYPLSSGGTTTVLAAGGGGASSAVFCSGPLDANGTCNSILTGYPAPPFQSSINAGNAAPAGVRYIPDVALFASPGYQHQAAWALCGDSTIEGLTTPSTDCVATSGAGFTVYGVGGTSASAPAFAGILAQIIESLPNHPRLGLANNVLYNLAATHGSIFHDVTLGNNSVPCATATSNDPSPNCGTNNFLSGFNAGTGYDLATGLGSFDINALVAGWAGAAFTPTSTALQVNGGTVPVSFQHGTAISLAANVTPSSATGDVAVTATSTGQGGAAVREVITLQSGGGAISPVTDFPGGSYTLQAYYQGDVTHAPSTSATPISVTISPEASAPFLSLAIIDPAKPGTIQSSPTTTAVTYGEIGYAYVQPGNASALDTNTPLHGIATGSATLLNGTTRIGTQPLNSQGLTTFPLYDLAPGTYSFSAQYSGDSSYNASATTTSLPLTISKGPTTLGVHVGTSATTGQARTITVYLDTDSVGALPTGAVSLSFDGTNYTSTTVQNGTTSSGAVRLYANFSVPAKAITGSNRLSAAYPGDGNYAGANAATCTYAPTATSSLLPQRRNGLLYAMEGGTALCGLLLFGMPARRRGWRAILGLILAVGVVGAAVGCGSSSSSSSGSGNTPLVSACAQ